ncbi:MAG: DUF6702 family protein [Pseudomonadota bacterium]
MIRDCIRCVLIAWLALQPAGVHAHRLKLSTTDIEWRASAGTLDVTHQLHLDDALTLLASLGAPDGLIDLEAAARLMNYVDSHFELRGTSAIPLEPFGAHIEGNTLWVYQRSAPMALPAALEIESSLLHELVDGMRNDLNWRVGDLVRSTTTAADQPLRWLRLSPEPQ